MEIEDFPGFGTLRELFIQRLHSDANNFGVVLRVLECERPIPKLPSLAMYGIYDSGLTHTFALINLQN